MKYVVVVVLIMLAACVQRSVPETDQAPTVDPRTPYDLVDAIREARRSTIGPDDPVAALAADWSGRRYRWSLRYVPSLCARADACRLLPFDHARAAMRPMGGQGWLATLVPDDAVVQSLRRRCAGHPRCVVDIEGRLALSVGAGLPPNVVLSDVSVLGSRGASPGEAWVRRSSASALTR